MPPSLPPPKGLWNLAVRQFPVHRNENHGRWVFCFFVRSVVMLGLSKLASQGFRVATHGTNTALAFDDVGCQCTQQASREDEPEQVAEGETHGQRSNR